MHKAGVLLTDGSEKDKKVCVFVLEFIVVPDVDMFDINCAQSGVGWVNIGSFQMLMCLTV